MLYIEIVDDLFALSENCKENDLKDLLRALCRAKYHFRYVGYAIFEKIDYRIDSADDRVIVVKEK